MPMKQGIIGKSSVIGGADALRLTQAKRPGGSAECDTAEVMASMSKWRASPRPTAGLSAIDIEGDYFRLKVSNAAR